MRLFKYLTPDRTDVLKNQSIRFTQAKYLNDPFEWLPFVNRLMTQRAAKNFYTKYIEPSITQISNRKLNINDIPEEYHDKIPKEALDEVFKLTVGEGLSLLPQVHPKNLVQLFFANSREQFNINISEILKDSWNKYYGVLSLTQSNCNIPMWSHYARNHQGFVIEFDPTSIFFNTNPSGKGINKQLKKVEYSESRNKISIIEDGEDVSSGNSILERIANEVFFTKSSHWKDEEEFRLLDKLENHSKKINIGDQEIYLFDFDPKAIISVYFGVNATDKTIDEINHILDSNLYSHVTRFYSELDLKDYQINFIK